MPELGKRTESDNIKRRLIVHCGVQKTGSTSIQRHLVQNLPLLADFFVIRTPEAGTPMRPLGRAAVDLSLHPDSLDSKQAFKIALDDVLDTVPANDLPILISHENLAGAMPGNGGETRLYPALPLILTTIQRHLGGFSVDFVYYTRAMVDWKPSVWAQAVRTDGYTRTEQEFMAEIADLPGWNDLRERLVKAVGKSCLTRFKLEDEPDPRHPGWQLLRHAGLPEDSFTRLQPLQGTAMPRLNGAATEFIRKINSLNLNPHARLKVTDLVAREQNLFYPDPRPEGTL